MSDVIQVAHGDLSVTHERTSDHAVRSFRGVPTDGDLRACLLELWRHPDYRYDQPELHDHRQIDPHRLTPAGIREIGALWSEEVEGGEFHRIAVLAANDFLYGLVRMFAGHARGLGSVISVFDDPDAAMEWLMSAPEPGVG